MQPKYLVTAAFAMLALPTAARAQDANEDSPAITLSADATVVSDYRFRGVSLSNGDYAVQGSVTVSTRQGFYASAWASNIAEYGGAKTEVDVTGGWSGALGPLTADVNVVGYYYPNGEGVNYYEVGGSLSKEFGPLGAKVGVAYSPKQDNIGGIKNTYIYGEASYALPVLPITLNAHVGHEDGVYSGKVDYAVGASVKYAPFTFGVSYIKVDSDPLDELGELAGNKMLFSVKAGF